ncbi:MAG: DoxX family protein [Patescibacteria group bacterium]
MTKTHKIIFYTLLTLISIGFLGAAFPKLSSDPNAIAGFAQAYLPVWFMYFIGCAEVLGVIGLWIPKLFRFAAYGLWIILAGAIVTTILFTPMPGIAIIPAVYAIILGIIYWLNSKRGSAPMTPAMPTEAPTQNPIA